MAVLLKVFQLLLLKALVDSVFKAFKGQLKDFVSGLLLHVGGSEVGFNLMYLLEAINLLKLQVYSCILSCSDLSCRCALQAVTPHAGELFVPLTLLLPAQP